MLVLVYVLISIFFFQAEDVIRVGHVTGVQTCALPISIFFGPFDHLTDWEGVVLTPLYLGHPAPQHRLTRQSEPESELSIPHDQGLLCTYVEDSHPCHGEEEEEDEGDDEGEAILSLVPIALH